MIISYSYLFIYLEKGIVIVIVVFACFYYNNEAVSATTATATPATMMTAVVVTLPIKYDDDADDNDEVDSARVTISLVSSIRELLSAGTTTTTGVVSLHVSRNAATSIDGGTKTASMT